MSYPVLMGQEIKTYIYVDIIYKYGIKSPYTAKEAIMSGKYHTLEEHLLSRDDSLWSATFKEIEGIIDGDLPDSARKHQAWWANQGSGHSQHWQRAGWKTTAVDLENERLTFIRKQDRRQLVGGDGAQFSSDATPLTVAQAKDGLAVQFGIDPSQIEIIIKV